MFVCQNQGKLSLCIFCPKETIGTNSKRRSNFFIISNLSIQCLVFQNQGTSIEELEGFTGVNDELDECIKTRELRRSLHCESWESIKKPSTRR